MNFLYKAYVNYTNKAFTQLTLHWLNMCHMTNGNSSGKHSAMLQLLHKKHFILGNSAVSYRFGILTYWSIPCFHTNLFLWFNKSLQLLFRGSTSRAFTKLHGVHIYFSAVFFSIWVSSLAERLSISTLSVAAAPRHQGRH